MEELVIDSNVIVEYLKSKGGILPQIWEHYKLHISTATLTELYATKKSLTPEVKAEIDEIVKKHFTIIEIDATIALKAAEILHSLNITLASAYVAAASIVKDIPLVTYDLSTFDLIPDLKIVDI